MKKTKKDVVQDKSTWSHGNIHDQREVPSENRMERNSQVTMRKKLKGPKVLGGG